MSELKLYDGQDAGTLLKPMMAMALLDSGQPVIVKSPRTGDGIYIRSYEDLQAYNAFERATSVPASFPTAEQAKAAPMLRFFEDGLYGQRMEGGFFGVGEHPNRLTAFEAWQELHAGRTVTVRDRQNHAHDLANFQQLQTLFQHQLD